jgi:hypothetical protein
MRCRWLDGILISADSTLPPTIDHGCASGLLGTPNRSTAEAPMGPGGAVALTAILGGAGVHSEGYHFVLTPVLLNSLMRIPTVTPISADSTLPPTIDHGCASGLLGTPNRSTFHGCGFSLGG